MLSLLAFLYVVFALSAPASKTLKEFGLIFFGIVVFGAILHFMIGGK